jgi:hypothetical protein
MEGYSIRCPRRPPSATSGTGRPEMAHPRRPSGRPMINLRLESPNALSANSAVSPSLPATAPETAEDRLRELGLPQKPC